MPSVTLRCFASAREAAGTASDEFAASTVAALLAMAGERYGAEWRLVLQTSRVWLNGDEPADGEATELHHGDEVAVLPPVSGGA